VIGKVPRICYPEEVREGMLVGIAVQFGAGSIGRGFLGQLLHESAYEIVFVEMRDDIVARLNSIHSYRLRIAEKHSRELVIKNVRAINARSAETVAKEIEKADVMATAVGARNLRSVASLVVEGMSARANRRIEEPINLIICENLPQSSKVFRDYLREQVAAKHQEYLASHLGLVESVVSRMVPLIPPEMQEEDPTFVMAEEYSRLPVDRKGFKGRIPRIRGMVPCSNLFAHEEQKLFIHNTGHAICAYLGYFRGYRYIWEAIEDRGIYKVVKGALEETGKALIKKHGFKLEDQQTYMKDILQRLANRALSDTVVRVGRDPIRKLGSPERLVGAAKLVCQYGIVPGNVSHGIAAALLFDEQADKEARELTQIRKEQGIDAILREICQIDPKGSLATLIKKNLKELTDESSRLERN